MKQNLAEIIAFVAWILIILGLMFLFWGEPDVFDALIEFAKKRLLQ
jgi:hypothetical protein